MIYILHLFWAPFRIKITQNRVNYYIISGKGSIVAYIRRRARNLREWELLSSHPPIFPLRIAKDKPHYCKIKGPYISDVTLWEINYTGKNIYIYIIYIKLEKKFSYE